MELKNWEKAKEKKTHQNEGRSQKVYLWLQILHLSISQTHLQNPATFKYFLTSNSISI